MPGDIVKLLRCPVCRGDLAAGADVLTCQVTSCGESFPLSPHGPVLINEANSVFDIETFLQQEETFFKNVHWFRSLVSRCLPNPSANVAAGRVLTEFRDRVMQRSDNPTVLVIGGSIVGDSIDVLIHESRIQLVETDVAIGPRTQVICDGHDLPFADASFDGVVAQAVLEHVVDPARCVEEIHRVLRPDGLVYSDIPFMQQVHGREFAFTRYSRLPSRPSTPVSPI